METLVKKSKEKTTLLIRSSINRESIIVFLANNPDNSACEGFFGRMKTECFYNHSLEDLSLEELKIYMNRYIQWYNNDRIKNTLGGLSPVQYRLSREQSE